MAGEMPMPVETVQRDFPHVAAVGQFFRLADFHKTFELGWDLMPTGIAAPVKSYEGRR